MSLSNLEFAREIRFKFDLYFLGLIFTILGLSIQTAKFEYSLRYNLVEIVSWSLLLLSALLIFWALNQASEFYSKYDLYKELTTTLKDIDLNNLDSYTEIDKHLLETTKKETQKYEDSLRRYEKAHLYGGYIFYFGMCLLVISRSFPVLIPLFK